MRGGRHRAAAYPLTKISAWVDEADWRWLQCRHRYDASAVLRRLISEYRQKIEEPRAAEKWDFDLEGL